MWRLILLCLLGFWVLVYLCSALFIHFRGKVRHRFLRQLSDHSTLMAPYNAMIYLFSGVANKPVLDLNDFPQLSPLKSNWQTIRDEAMRLYDQGHIKQSENFNDLAFNTFFKRGWKRFYLKWYDDFMPSAKELCPQTVELVQSIPSVNAALFAVLAPQSKLGAHRDPFAGSLRYHLGLKTPNSDQCRIYIDGEPYAWRDGQDILFDETYIHKVRNDTDEARVILFCDVARPIRNRVVRALNHFITHHIVKATATQNTDKEKVGVLNRFSRYIYAFRETYEGQKKGNRRLFNIGKYALAAAVVGLIVFVGLRHR